MKAWLQSFVVAVQFLTRIPVPIRVPYHVRTVSRSVTFYPIVGGIIGFILYIVIHVLPKEVVIVNSVILLFIWVVLTGGLHMDGWMDTADGLGSHRKREQMLEIMKDSRVGAFGVLASFFVLLMKWTSLLFLLDQWEKGHISDDLLLFVLLLVPVMSRWWMGTAIVGWPYIGGENGLGRFFQETKRWHLAVSSLCVVVLILIFLPGILWLSIIGGSLFSGWWFNHYVSKRLGGLTGDTYGALNEFVEAVGLICAVYLSTWLS